MNSPWALWRIYLAGLNREVFTANRTATADSGHGLLYSLFIHWRRSNIKQ
uniref:Uncharacterized protein n=1 Tax=Anguilla anguilla TaxID=7936 RepID=A0A0E9WBR2_ANGAN